jgi:hypothetical protein
MGNHTLSRPSVNRYTIPRCTACADPPEVLTRVDVYAVIRTMYANWPERAQAEERMARTAGLKRKSSFVAERTLERAKKALGVPTDAQVVRLSLERAAEMEEFWRFMLRNRRRILKPGSIKSP